MRIGILARSYWVERPGAKSLQGTVRTQMLYELF